MDINLVVMNEHWDGDLEERLFGPLEPGEAITRMLPTAPVDMYDILVLHGSFPSKGQARKNWTRTGAEIPPGFSDWWIGKKKQRLTIWRPMPGRWRPSSSGSTGWPGRSRGVRPA